MKFNDAWEKVVANTPPDSRIKPDDRPEIKNAKMMALIWSIIAISENVLDDIAYIDNTMNIVSIPLEQKGKGQKPSTKSKKAAEKTGEEEQPPTDENEQDEIVEGDGEEENTGENPTE
jgi:hypothetical protein